MKVSMAGWGVLAGRPSHNIPTPPPPSVADDTPRLARNLICTTVTVINTTHGDSEDQVGLRDP